MVVPFFQLLQLNISDPDKKSEASYRGKFCSFAGQKSADKRVEAPQGLYY